MVLTSQRHLFDLGDDHAYLNSAYLGPLPTAAVEAGHRALLDKAQPWRVTPADFFEPVETLRSQFAHFTGLDVEGIAVTPSVSYGMAVAAHNLELASGQKIVVLAEQFPSNVYAWTALAVRTGATVHTVPRPDGHEWTTAVVDAIAPETAVVAIPPCHWTDGTVVDLVAVADRATRVGAALVIDVSQALGAMVLPLAEIQPDFVMGVAYKWLLGPYTLGFLYAAPQHRQGEPLERSWVGRADSDDFSGLVDYRDEFRPGARRYDMGQVASFVNVATAIAAFDLLRRWPTAEIADYAAGLTGRVAEAAEELGMGVAPPARRAPHLIGVRLPPGADPAVVAAELDQAGVNVSVRGDSVRVSAHIFNTVDDVDRLVAALATTLRP